MSSVHKDSKRDLILKAASMIVHEEGVERLTLEAVAKKAGISKGGLLYHFPNKEELISGMIEKLSRDYVTELGERVELDANHHGKWTRAYVASSDQCVEGVFDPSTALTAALFSNPQMLKSMQDEYAVIQEKLADDGIDPVRATIIRLAVDGLWFAEMFGLAPPNGELKQQVIEQLRTWTKEEK
ncbi:TetR/AcrR family transcriptional regulator [Paenibacillus puldeungensis]|uniref:TetR/AcrR family transcriptional regulator n=1 Tax=Paenibacillus puldeungensis TaxID=696536 RepID=A0ABW3S2W0_9BACL